MFFQSKSSVYERGKEYAVMFSVGGSSEYFIKNELVFVCGSLPYVSTSD